MYHDQVTAELRSAACLWSFSDDTLLEENVGAASLTVVTRWGEELLSDLDPDSIEALCRMRYGPVSLTTARVNGRLAALLNRLRGAVVPTLAAAEDGRPMLSAVPEIAEPQWIAARPASGAPLRLSRFATLRPVDGALLLEVPGAPFHVLLLTAEARAVAASFACTTTVGALAEDVELPRALVSDMVSFLAGAGVLMVGDGDGFAEDHDPVRRGWSHHELLFHHRTGHREGERPADVVVETALRRPEPVTLDRPRGRCHRLGRPTSLGELARTDPPLTTLLETEHCDPRFTGGELSADRLGELLFRSARVRSRGPTDTPPSPCDRETSRRPYLNHACLYELEIYAVVNRCPTLPRAIYHYDPVDHALILVRDDDADVANLLDAAAESTGSPLAPTALLAVTARMPRTSWLLGGGSYAMALVHCGALAETVHLAAQTMGMGVRLVPPFGGRAEHALRLPWPAEVCVAQWSVESLTNDEA